MLTIIIVYYVVVIFQADKNCDHDQSTVCLYVGGCV